MKTTIEKEKKIKRKDKSNLKNWLLLKKDVKSDQKKVKSLIDFSEKWQKKVKMNIPALRGAEVLYKIEYETETLKFMLEISKNSQGVYFYLSRKWKEFTSQTLKYSKYDVDDRLGVNSKASVDVRVWFTSFEFYNYFIGIIEDAYKQVAITLSENYAESDKDIYQQALYNYLALNSNQYFKQFLTYKLIADIFINKSFENYKQELLNILKDEQAKINPDEAILSYFLAEQNNFIKQIENTTKFLSKKVLTNPEDPENPQIVYEYPQVVEVYQDYKVFQITSLADIKAYLELYEALKEAINNSKQDTLSTNLKKRKHK